MPTFSTNFPTKNTKYPTYYPTVTNITIIQTDMDNNPSTLNIIHIIAISVLVGICCLVLVMCLITRIIWLQRKMREQTTKQLPVDSQSNIYISENNAVKTENIEMPNINGLKLKNGETTVSENNIKIIENIEGDTYTGKIDESSKSYDDEDQIKNDYYMAKNAQQNAFDLKKLTDGEIHANKFETNK